MMVLLGRDGPVLSSWSQHPCCAGGLSGEAARRALKVLPGWAAAVAVGTGPRGHAGEAGEHRREAAGRPAQVTEQRAGDTLRLLAAPEIGGGGPSASEPGDLDGGP